MDESWSILSTLSGPALADLGTIRAVATAGEPGEIFLSGKSSGVAVPLAAWCGGQICRLIVLGFGK